MQIARLAAALAVAVAFASPVAVAHNHDKDDVTEAEINAAQDRWCAGLVNIGKVHRDGGDVVAAANKVLDDSYHFDDDGEVLFKPTLAYGERTFRLTREGALAYFVGGNAKFPEDKGFALTPWVGCRYQNAGTITEGDIGISMGNVWVKNEKGEETMVDKTFVFKRDTDGVLRLIVHKSALPFAPAPAAAATKG